MGFRPFIWQLAQQFGIKGEVLNDPEGVLIRAHGERLDAFVSAITRDAPPLARVDTVESEPFAFETLPGGFRIVASQGAGAETRVTPDAATCPACLADIRGEDPRRKAYAFTNCTHCGPRFTILRGLPYDRAKTTMAPFAMCTACASEYTDPADRRFHAQPVACAACGPRLSFEDSAEPIASAAAWLREGAILGIKGLGGFHICCDATNPAAIAKLRERKRRPTKPLALMGRWEDITAYAAPSEDEEAALASAAAPILLLSKMAPLPDTLAPGQSRLGWMLPYTPLHHLLLDTVQRPLVMTSGNLSGEPQVIGNDEARDKLSGIVDGILNHDRDIARRLDDSVIQLSRNGPMILRRARGMVPETLPLPPGFEDAPQTVAFGAHLKSAICLIKNGQALLSHHLGDLDDALTWDEFVKADADYADLFDHHPEVFACDLHPGYRSSQHASARSGGAAVEVQHHHAHLAACLAENGWALDGGKVAGIILDGLGLGDDGTIWGGELIVGDYLGYDRRAHLRPVPLPGGDAANREPWRNLLAQLDAARMPELADMRLAGKPLHLLRQAMASGTNAPLSSSAGRLFDAMAAWLGLAPDHQSYEGEAAMLLESLALAGTADPIPLPVTEEGVDPAPLFADALSGADAAMRFHLSLAHAFASQARSLLVQGEVNSVALSGGCFQNALLLDLTLRALDGLPVLVHTRVPANDGGLALGQGVIAAARAMRHR